MGRSSTSSCFKIITCGSDAADTDHLNAHENKTSSDKRGWSFRKRSTRHRILSNTVILERPSSGIKEPPESAPVNFQTQANSTIPVKTSGLQWADEKPQSVNFNLSETTIVATVDDNKVDVTPDESVIIVIQTAIRGFLARRDLLKQNNIVKLQAAVRGYLVRKHAVGTLRCVQAIFKMQALVRARHACRTREGPSIEENLNEKHGKDNHRSELLESKLHVTHTSIEKLLSNSFACQLLETTPRTKRINLKCDPSKSDSSWKWLERWMSASSTGNEQSQILHLNTEPQELEKVEHFESLVETVIPSDGCCKPTDSRTSLEKAVVSASSTGNEQSHILHLSTEPQELEKVEHFESLVETVFPSDGCCKPTDSRTSLEKAAVPFESEENLITYDADSFNFHACQPISSSVSPSLEQPLPESPDTSNLRENSLDLLSSHTKQLDSINKMDPSSLSNNSEMESEQSKHIMKRFDSEQSEIEEQKFVVGSIKASNPAFIAAQSKFEELSSAANSAKSNSLLIQDFGVGVESNSELVCYATDNAFGTRGIGQGENSHTSMVQVGGSECGTELSITSTLDSPDRFEAGGMDIEQEANILEAGTSNPKNNKSLDIESKEESIILGTNLPNSISVQPDKCDDINDASNEHLSSVIVPEDSSQVEQTTTEKNASNMKIELKSESGHQVYKSSAEASPRSHLTVPESQGTPSSQVSAKAKKPKSEKSGSKQKPRSSPAGKRSFSNANHDSGARSSVEHLPKDHKTGKRRNSFGSARPDHVDQEPRDSISSSNSLPNYMQATESAKAKALVNSSPRSSPDVQDKNIYIKKRHSLPGANGRQGSPQIQLSPSQAQQSAKGNGIHPHERKWQR